MEKKDVFRCVFNYFYLKMIQENQKMSFFLSLSVSYCVRWFVQVSIENLSASSERDSNSRSVTALPAKCLLHWYPILSDYYEKNHHSDEIGLADSCTATK